MKNWLIKKLGGYISDEVLTEAVKDLFNTISADDILRQEGNDWFVGDKKLNDGDKKLLIAEANQFLITKLWQVLQNDIFYQANRAMFEKSKSKNDMVAGKLFLYALDSIKTRLESLSKESGNFNQK